MTHETEVLGFIEQGNGQHSILVRCCGKHLHWHTIDNVNVGADPAKLEQSIAEARALASQNHEAKLLTPENISAHVGVKVTHG